MQMPELDDVDIQILRLIKYNARMNYSDIAAQVGISRVAIKNHIVALEKKGIIQGYETKIVQPKSPERIMFMLDITTTIDKYEAMLQELKSYAMLQQIYMTTGECRIHCVGVAPDSNRLQIFVNNLYRNTEGMMRLECHTVLSTIKDLDGGVDYGKEFNEQENSRGD